MRNATATATAIVNSPNVRNVAKVILVIACIYAIVMVIGIVVISLTLKVVASKSANDRRALNRIGSAKRGYPQT